MGVMHSGQEARGKISDRHYGDIDSRTRSLSHTHTLEPFHLLPETVKCPAESNLDIIFQSYEVVNCVNLFINVVVMVITRY